MKKELIKLANHLDRVGLIKEADYVDSLLKKANPQNQDEPFRRRRQNYRYRGSMSESSPSTFVPKEKLLRDKMPSNNIDECKGTRHEVKGGENLEGIAKFYFEDQKSNRSDLQYEKWEDLYKELKRLNKIENSSLIRRGLILCIPSKNEVYMDPPYIAQPNLK